MTKIERNYVKWYLHENAKKYCLLVMVLFVTLPVMSIVLPGNASPQNYNYVQPMLIQIFVVAILGSFLALGFALYNFRYLANKRAVAMYYGMPIKKSRMFVIQFAIGAISIFVLLFVMFALAIVLDPAIQEAVSVYWAYNFCVALMCVCLYTMYVAIIMKCRNAWDACLVCLGYTILPFFVYLALSQMLNETLSESLYSNQSSAEEFFPMTIILQCLSIPSFMIRFGTLIISNTYSMHFDASLNAKLWENVLNVYDFSLWVMLFWLVIAIVLFFVARRIYLKRGSEESEQRTTAYMCYPFLSLLLASCLIMFDVYPYRSGGRVSLSIPITMIFISFIIYLIMNFFARRKIQCTKGMIFSFVSVVACVFVLQYACISTKGFYQVKEVPSLDDVVSIDVSTDTFDSDGLDKGMVFNFKNPAYQDLNNQALTYLGTADAIEDKDLMEKIVQFHEDIVDVYTDVCSQSVSDLGVMIIGFRINYIDKYGRGITRYYNIYDNASLEKSTDLIEYLVDQGLCGTLEDIQRSNGLLDPLKGSS